MNAAKTICIIGWGCLLILAGYGVVQCAETAPKSAPVIRHPKDTNAEAPALPGPRDLQSVKAKETNAPAVEDRFPLHVIPEAIVVKTPLGIMVFVERVDVERLARYFPAQRLTNVIVYNK